MRGRVRAGAGDDGGAVADLVDRGREELETARRRRASATRRSSRRRRARRSRCRRGGARARGSVESTAPSGPKGVTIAVRTSPSTARVYSAAATTPLARSTRVPGEVEPEDRRTARRLPRSAAPARRPASRGARTGRAPARSSSASTGATSAASGYAASRSSWSRPPSAPAAALRRDVQLGELDVTGAEPALPLPRRHRGADGVVPPLAGPAAVAVGEADDASGRVDRGDEREGVARGVARRGSRRRARRSTHVQTAASSSRRASTSSARERDELSRGAPRGRR